MKKSKNIIITIIVAVIILMAVAYSSFATQLKINGTAEIIGEWNIKITNVEVEYASDGCSGGEPKYTVSTASFDAKLNKPGDKVIYKISIKNAGTINATLNSVTFTPDNVNGSPAINYSYTEPAKILNSGEETSLTVTATYDEQAEEVPEIKTKTITGIIEYVQT